MVHGSAPRTRGVPRSSVGGSVIDTQSVTLNLSPPGSHWPQASSTEGGSYTLPPDRVPDTPHVPKLGPSPSPFSVPTSSGPHPVPRPRPRPP